MSSIDPLLRIGEVTRMIGVCRQTIYLWIRAGAFPEPLHIGAARRTIAWRQSTIDAWITSQGDTGGAS